nr:uncharacterized protein LOC107442331 [Parasteatoda tepidariorum]
MSYRNEHMKETGGNRKKRFENEKKGYSDPTVLVGQWFEERARKEADYVEFLQNYGNENTPVQKFMKYKTTLNDPTSLTESRDGYLHNKDAVNICWCTKLSTSKSSQKQHVYLSALPFEIKGAGDFVVPCIATAVTAKNGNIARCTFYICRANTAVPDNVPIMYNECVRIVTTGNTGGVLTFIDTAYSARSLPQKSEKLSPNYI